MKNSLWDGNVDTGAVLNITGKQKTIQYSKFTHNNLKTISGPLLFNVNISQCEFIENSIQFVRKRFSFRETNVLVAFMNEKHSHYRWMHTAYEVTGSIFSANWNIVPEIATIYAAVPIISITNNEFFCDRNFQSTAPIALWGEGSGIESKNNPTVLCAPLPCENGAYSPNPPLIQCKFCPAGQFAPSADSLQCEFCKDGFYPLQTNRTCEICPAGHEWKMVLETPQCNLCVKPYYKESPGVGLCDQICAQENGWSPSGCVGGNTPFEGRDLSTVDVNVIVGWVFGLFVVLVANICVFQRK